jgi:hypothetical protein
MMRRLLRRPALALLALLAVLGGSVAAGVILAGPAAAEQVCHEQAVKEPDGSIHYVRVCEDVDPGSPGGPGNGPSLADCGLDRVQPTPPGTGYGSWYCVGTRACAIKDNIVPLAPPTEAAPPGQQWVAQGCTDCLAGACGPIALTLILTGPVARPLIVQALEAFGNLNPPAGSVQHSPNARAVVQLDTWFWLDPATFGIERGTSAEGLVAVAEPQATEWDPGDGSAVITCTGPGTPYAEGADASHACTHTYTAMSPHYDGQVTRHWAVHYEVGGAPITIAGAPAELTATTPFALTVVETQVVGGN